MQAFARLYLALDASTAVRDKLAALQAYLAEAPPADAAWAVYLLAGGRPRRLVPTAVLREAAREAAGLPEWLFEASYQAVGDLAETIACLLGDRRSDGAEADASADTSPDADPGLAGWIEQRLLPLRGAPPEQQARALQGWWRGLDATGCFLLVKLIGGGWRVGVSRQLVQRALAAHAGLAPAQVAMRMMTYTDAGRAPDAARYLALIAPGDAGDEPARPYPFFLAHPLDVAPDLVAEAEAAPLGPVQDWQLEWKFDGIRAQIVRRAGGGWIWSRGEEAIGPQFPELLAEAAALPEGCVLDGELIVRASDPQDPRPAPFAALQQRLQRKRVDPALLERLPAAFIAYDLLEWQGRDLRGAPLAERRARLEALFEGRQHAGWRLSPRLAAADWAAAAALRACSREHGVEGLMLKHRDSVYGSGRQKPPRAGAGADSTGLGWWKWKIEPWTVDAVLLYAQAGHGRRASLYTDYTFAVWNRPPRDAAEAQAVVEAIARREPPQPGGLQLVTLAKAYSGLSDAEILRVDRLVRASTLERFGPVRSLRPSLVMELAFEGIAPSARHRSGLALRFPRLRRIRDDKPLHEADHLPGLRERLLPGAG